MVLGVIDLIVELLATIMSNYVQLPEIVTQPLISNVYAVYVFFGLMVLTVILYLTKNATPVNINAAV